MPFQSVAQKNYLFAKEPKVAKRWADEYGVPKNLPVRKGGGPIQRKLAKVKK